MNLYFGSNNMSLHRLERIQTLPISLEEAWNFFSSPANLQAITPEYMGFKVLSNLPPKMYAGQIIEYKVSPVMNLPLHWVTEITHVEAPVFFIDEQRFGPYSFWHHQHHFLPINGGVQMKDIVHYKLPFGPLGDLAHALFVKRQLEEIFDFRFKILEEKFGKM